MNHDSLSLFKHNLHLFTEKYPHYSYLGWEHFLTNQKKISSKKYPFEPPKLSEDSNALIFLGLEGEDFYPFLKSWLYHHPGRRVLLVLKSFQEFLSFCMKHPLKDLLHLNHLEWLICTPENEEEALHAWLFKHYYLRMQIVENIYSLKQKKAYQPIVEKLQSHIHLLHQRQIEEIFFEKNLINYLNNLHFLPQSGFVHSWKDKFKNIPAIICGAGSSLENDLPSIKNAQKNALIISTGSGCKALIQNGISPHLAVACDPNPEEGKRFHNVSLHETILVYSHRLNHEVVKKAPHLAYLFTGLEKGFDAWVQKEMHLQDSFHLQTSSSISFSCSILALATAVYLGCNPITFCGMDLSFTQNKHYISGIQEHNSVIVENQKKLISKKDIHKKAVYTKLEFLLEKEDLSSYLKQYPEVQFFYSGSGLGLVGAKNCSIDKIAKKYFLKELDIRNLCHKINKESIKNFGPISQKIKKLISPIHIFMEKIEEILEKLEHVYPQALIAIHEMQEEENYSLFIEPFLNQWRWRSLEALHSDEKKEKYIFILQQLKRIEKNLMALSDQK